MATCKRIKLDYTHAMHKIHSKRIKELNVRPETIKVLEENLECMLFDNGLSNMFLDISPQVRETKAKKKKELHQTKKLLHSVENYQQKKKLSTEW